MQSMDLTPEQAKKAHEEMLCGSQVPSDTLLAGECVWKLVKDDSPYEKIYHPECLPDNGRHLIATSHSSFRTWKTCEFCGKPIKRDMGKKHTANAAPHTGAVAPSVQALVGGFDPCCGQPPKVTEWRPGCYGAQCMECGGIVGDERQLDRNELMAEWNRVMRKRTANTPREVRETR